MSWDLVYRLQMSRGDQEYIVLQMSRDALDPRVHAPDVRRSMMSCTLDLQMSCSLWSMSFIWSMNKIYIQMTYLLLRSGACTLNLGSSWHLEHVQVLIVLDIYSSWSPLDIGSMKKMYSRSPSCISYWHLERTCSGENDIWSISCMYAPEKDIWRERHLELQM